MHERLAMLHQRFLDIPEEARREIALDPNTHLFLLILLAKDYSEYVQQAAWSNPALQEAMQDFAEEQGIDEEMSIDLLVDDYIRARLS